jgi:2-dehydropantoate 2-reductase
MKMRVVVVGAGAIGGFIGARLALAGNEVTLLGRPWLVDAVRARGLRLIEPRKECLVHRGLNVVSSIAEAAVLGPFDLALLTVKTYDVDTATRQMQESDLGHPPVLCLQNGIGSEERLSQAFGADRVIAGSLTQPVSVPEPGVVRLVKERGGFALAPVAQGVNIGPAAAVLRGGGLRVRLYRDYRAVKWSKLPLNMLGSTIPAILDMPPGEVYAHVGLLRLEIAAMRELMAVMRALGVRLVDLPGYPVRPLMWALRRLPVPLLAPLLHRLVEGGREGRVPSLQRGLAQGRTVSEVADLNGAVVRYGEHVGLPTPANRLLTETLEAIYAGRYAWSEWRRRPGRLIEAWEQAIAPA